MSSRVSDIEYVPLQDGRHVATRVWPGRGIPMVLLHGLLDSSEGWLELADAASRPCYAFDLPGFGLSSAPSEPLIGAYARDIAQACETLDLDDFILVGHSLGGAVAAAVSELLADQVRSLVLIAPASFGRQPAAELAQLPGVRTAMRVGLPFALVNPVWASAIYAALVANGQLPDSQLLARWRRQAFQVAPGAAAAAEAIHAEGRNPRALYKRQAGFTGPVRALWGSNDRLVPRAHIQGVKTAFPQADVTVWERMGHHPQRERPEQLAAYIDAACRAGRRRSQAPPLAA